VNPPCGHVRVEETCAFSSPPLWQVAPIELFLTFKNDIVKKMKRKVKIMKRLIVRKLVIFSHVIFFSFYHPE